MPRNLQSLPHISGTLIEIWRKRGEELGASHFIATFDRCNNYEPYPVYVMPWESVCEKCQAVTDLWTHVYDVKPSADE